VHDLFLEQLGDTKLQPVIAAFFRRLIDVRNMLALYKQVRWRLKGASPFIGGGTLGRGGLEEMAGKGDVAAVFHLVARLTGELPAAGGSLERHLLSWLTRSVRRWEVEGGEAGALLAHLWRCYVEARNLGVIIAGRSLDRASLREELVR
jgi:vacuolar-type H+-ATPase subunit C/Vma6